MRTEPRGSWFAEALRILERNPNDRAVRIDRTILAGLVQEMAAMAHRNKSITEHLRPLSEEQVAERQEEPK